jgi:hypothetical protein
MFCPNCRVEYRPGFTKCSDCGADLVEHLAGENLDPSRDVATDAEGRELLWSGLAPRLQSAICAALDSAHIKYAMTTREFGLLPTMGQSATFIWVDHHDRPAARSVLDEILSGDEYRDQVEEESTAEGSMNPFRFKRQTTTAARDDDDEAAGSEEELSESADTEEPLPEDFAEEPQPEEATAEVWSGDDAETADFIKTALAGVGVGCVVSERDGKSSVFVIPEAEKRAREVVREIIDQTPQE